jgi:hypothetical protein
LTPEGHLKDVHCERWTRDPAPELMIGLQKEFRKLCLGRIPGNAIEDVTLMALRAARQEVALAERSGDFSSIQTSPYLWAADLVAKPSFSDCIQFYALMDGSLSQADLAKALKEWRNRFTCMLRRRYIHRTTSSQPTAEPADDRRFQEPPSLQHSEEAHDPQAEDEDDPDNPEDSTDDDALEASPHSSNTASNTHGTGSPSDQLDATELEAACEDVISDFFNPDNLIPFLREGVHMIQPEDILDPAGILRRLGDSSSACRHLKTRVDERVKQLADEPDGFPAIRRAGSNPELATCYQHLKALIWDKEVWPAHWFESGLLSPQTLQAEAVARSSEKAARRYRRLVLNDVFLGLLSPRLGYSPRIGTLSTFIYCVLVNRFKDEEGKRLNEKRPHRTRTSPQPAPPRNPHVPAS